MGLDVTGVCPFCGTAIWDFVQHQECLRDRFAVAALTGMMAHEEWTTDKPEKVAAAAYENADAMLSARAARRGEEREKS